MKIFFLALSICLYSLLAVGQTPGLEKAYIITEKGDTLKGEAKPNKKELDNYSKITFKDEKGVQKMYRATKIKGYGIKDDHYISMDSDDEKKFYKVLASGDINFYKLGYEGLRMNSVVFEVEYYVSRKNDPELSLVKESKFKKQLGEWMEDNMEFIDAYGEDKKFDVEKALLAITNYNSWKAGK